MQQDDEALMFKRIVLKSISAVAALAMPTQVIAAPVLLECEIPNGSGYTLRMSVQLNEEAGTVSYSFPERGDAFRVRAIFAPDAVSFNGFSINRSTLEIRRVNDSALARLSDLPPVSVGRCQIDERERAF